MYRKRVLDEHPEIPFSIDEIEFADEDAVDEWIIKNQLGKHNLTEIQMTMLRGLLYKQRIKPVGNPSERDSAGKFQSRKNDAIGKRTSELVGEELGVSARTVETAATIVDGIERAASVDPEFKSEVLSGKVTAKKQDLAAIRKLDSDEEVKAAIEEIRNPTVQKVTSRTSGSKDQRIFNERLNAISAEMEKSKGSYTLDGDRKPNPEKQDLKKERDHQAPLPGLSAVHEQFNIFQCQIVVLPTFHNAVTGNHITKTVIDRPIPTP